MAGYTPLFSSLTTGTLCGRWPDIGLWPIILSLSDRHGVVDVTPAYLAGVTGLPLGEIVACMARFCQPDPCSRSPQDAGARLVLLDSHRDWGWKIVNHGLYREKARLMMREVDRVSSGENKARMKARTHKPPEDPRTPPKTPADPPSDSDSDSDSDKRKTQEARAAPAVLALHANLPKEAWEEWLAQRRKRRWPMDPVTLGKHLKVLVSYDAETQRRIIDNSINAGWQGLFPLKGNGSTKRPHREAPTTEELEAREAARARQ